MRMSTEVPDDERWETARRAVVERWTAALDRVAAHDEPGTLALTNAMDELCQEALRTRARAGGDAPSAALPCRYCREHLRGNGCLGLIGALNHWVLNGAWDDAARVVRERLRELGAPTGE